MWLYIYIYKRSLRHSFIIIEKMKIKKCLTNFFILNCLHKTSRIRNNIPSLYNYCLGQLFRDGDNEINVLNSVFLWDNSFAKNCTMSNTLPARLKSSVRRVKNVDCLQLLTTIKIFSLGQRSSVDWVPACDQRVVGLIPSQGTCLGCGPGPQ